MRPEHVKVRFNLERDADGWPPVESEGLWAMPVGTGTYRVDNTPWFVDGIAADDVVRAVPDPSGVLWATEVAHRSGRMTIRVIPFDAGPLHGDRQAVLDSFAPYGVSGEGEQQFGLVALDIPADADLAPIIELLEDGRADGRWEYDEGCVSDAWLALRG